MIEFKILRAARRVHGKLTTLAFRRTDFGLFMDLLGMVTWEKALEERGAQGSWLVTNEPPSSGVVHPKKEVRQERQEACMDEQGAPGQDQKQKGGLQRVEARTGRLGGIQRNCLSGQEPD
ncbi:a-kinase anchor protein 7 isoform gamma [Limosa lapponica baueri]|uniref:A-kinase anchor protein 7 isoform gamma n=1 Tax=Limosa lapponica baueri TaxID=1758121 RepID=A0A2I0UII8_LIMLA|nr:a-kinase anchor protein 7 isoform gamma [Limosa lapponica baueri]